MQRKGEELRPDFDPEVRAKFIEEFMPDVDPSTGMEFREELGHEKHAFWAKEFTSECD